MNSLGKPKEAIDTYSIQHFQTDLKRNDFLQNHYTINKTNTSETKAFACKQKGNADS